MELIIIAILFIILYPVFKVAYSVWRQIHSIKKQFGEQFGGNSPFGGSGNNDSRSSRRSSWQDYEESGDYGNRRHRHHFSSSEGQYVEFEEIIEERESVPYNSNEPYEPQISDAKYEEIIERVN